MEVRGSRMRRKRFRTVKIVARRSGSLHKVPRRWFKRIHKIKFSEEIQPIPPMPSSKELEELLSLLRDEIDRECGMSYIFEDSSGVIVLNSRFPKLRSSQE